MELFLFIYGVNVRVSTSDSYFQPVLEDLREDFLFFAAVHESSTIDIALMLEKSQSPTRGRGRFFFRNHAASVYGWGGDRVVDYGGGAYVHASSRPRSFEIFCERVEDAWECSYLAILSAVGEALDDRGYHRVHALGVEMNSLGGLIPLPSGGGKSSMAALLLSENDGKMKIFSDETPLISRGKLHAFPVRLALRRDVASSLGISSATRVFKRRRYAEKILLPIPARLVAETTRVSFVLVAGEARSDAEPTIRKCSRVRVFSALFESMVVGIGVAQIGEYLLRFDSIAKIIKIGFSRLFSALRISWQVNAYVFNLSKDPRKNVKVLSDFFNAQDSTSSR